MDAKTITKKIKVVAKDKEIRLADLAREAGYSPGTFAVKLSRGISQIDHAEKILNMLGCELIVVDRETKKVY